jgi:hypothetical protein
MSLNKNEIKKQLQDLGIKVLGNYVRKKDIEKIVKAKIDYEYAKDAAKYMWFIVKSDGSIHEGNESRDDAREALKELRETDRGAKLVNRSKVDSTKLAEFYKKNGVPQHMLEKGYREAKKDDKLAKDDPWGYHRKHFGDK